MKALLLFSLLGLHSISWSQADSSDHSAIRTVIDQLFDGMRSGDSSLVRFVFHADARAYTSIQNDGVFQLHSGSIDEFVGAVGTPHDEVWDERISNVQLDVDGGIAQVWMDYSFYLGNRLNHFGVNAFQLVKTDEGWKIIHLMDTRKSNP